jgi:hypothetical protein
LLSACGPRGPVLNEVTGTVLLDNKELDEGIIEFEPLDGQGTKQGAQIQNGRYSIPKTKGLAAGRYKVIIIGGDGLSGSGNAGAEPPKARTGGGTPAQERVAPEFNTHSKLVVEIKDNEPNNRDFTVTKREG